VHQRAGWGPSDFDDPMFLDDVRSGDRDAIAAVVHVYLEQVVRAARGAGLDDAQAEDVAQATFLTFIETASRFEGRSKLRTWLFGILFRKIAESRRAGRREDDTDDVDREFNKRFDEGGSWVRPPRRADREVEAGEIRTAISGCLEGAPQNQRIAFRLREIEGFDTLEICDILDVSSNNLGVMLHRVRNRLRECLETKGVQP
jgi:RNA polymerase sigma-70 factor (ECF subfamily)